MTFLSAEFINPSSGGGLALSPAQTPAAQDFNQEEEGQESGGLRPGRILQMLLRKRRILGICILLMISFNSFKAIQEKPTFKSSFRILVEPIQNKNQLNKITDEANGSSQEFDYSSQIEILLSPRVLAPVADQLSAKLPYISYSHIATKLSIFRLGETKIIEINYSSDNPAEVKEVLEAIADAYLRYSLNEQREQSRRGLDFVNQQMPQVQAHSDKLQQELQTLRQRYGFMNPEVYAQELRGQLGKAAEKLQGIQSTLLTLEARYQTLNGLAQSAILDQSQAYQAYLGQYQVLERQIAVETARYGENHPTIQLYRRQQENLLPLLQKEARRAIENQISAVGSDIRVAAAQRDAIEAIESELQKQLSQMPAILRRYNELLRQISVVNDSLKRLLETKETLEIAASQSEVPWQMITEIKEPETQLGMSLSKAFVMGLLGGGVLGTVLVYSIEKIENTFHTVEDLLEETRVPVFGIVPLRKNLKKTGPSLHQVDFWQQKRIKELTTGVKTEEGLSLTYGERLPTLESGIALIDPEELIGDWGIFWNADKAYTFLESFRTLQVNLSQRETLKSLTVSSAEVGEGKTTVAVMLAQAAAAMGKKVLLVDAHLQQGEGAVHEFLSMTAAPGLTDYLLELRELKDCIRPVIWETNFWVLTMGAIATDPSRFLSSTRMNELMQRVQQQFDWVIYNVPSLSALADARLVARKTQGVLLVMQMGRWNARTRFEQVQQDLNTASIPLAGIVVNGATEKSAIQYQRER